MIFSEGSVKHGLYGCWTGVGRHNIDHSGFFFFLFLRLWETLFKLSTVEGYEMDISTSYPIQDESNGPNAR